MLHLALRNLFQNRTQLLISVGGVALALLLILSLDAIFTGSERQVTAYVDNSGSDVFVSQEKVRNMHMASSALPASLSKRLGKVMGVRSVTPILYVTNMVVSGEDRHLAYIIGLPRRPAAGAPWGRIEGDRIPGDGGAVIDRDVAVKSGVKLGDEVKIMGRRFEVTGLAQGTASLVNSVAFISLDDFARTRGSRQTVSFFLLRTEPGSPASEVAARVEDRIAGVTAQTQQAFSRQERKVIRDMGTDVIAIMNLVGFLTGLAVVALTVYIATLARRTEYGVLKALGARNRRLYGSVLAQAAVSVALGFALALAVTLGLSSALPALGFNLALVVTGASLSKVAAMSLLIAGVSAILPVRQIAGLDPAIVFRRTR